MKTGTITGLEASCGSGMATLLVKHRNRTDRLVCDNGPLVRALDRAFGCITGGHSVDVTKIVGQKIRYQTDDLGMLAGFEPV